jgi:membrane peptidoglycan carboxypeptidase
MPIATSPFVRAIGAVLVTSAVATGCYSYETPRFEITIPETAESSTIVAADGTHVTTMVAPVNRTSVRRIDEIPEMLRQAVISIEDERFYIHDGIDLKAIIRAARTNFEAGGISQGGSTITQQYVKLAIIQNTEKTASRKLEEIWYATRLEDEYGKDFILLQYLNTVYFGHGAYGIRAAAQTYFNKDLHEVNLPEAAMLAGIIQLPGRYDPLLNYEKSLKRSHMVLGRMLANEYISEDQYNGAIALPPVTEEYTARLETRYPAGHFIEEVRQWFLENPVFGTTRGVREQLLFEGGVRIETTLDLELQAAAEAAVEKYLPDGEGYPDAAIVTINPQNGHILAMVGGRDFFADSTDAKYNLAIGLGRQVGSSMKPIGLAAALEAGWSATASYPAPNVIEFEIAGTIEENRVWRVTGGVNGHKGLEARFEEGLAALEKYQRREEHIDVPPDHVETVRVWARGSERKSREESVQLAAWINNRRYEYSQGELFTFRVEALEAVPGWTWEPPEGEALMPPPVPESVTLIRGVRSSYNTVYAQLNIEMGPHRVVSLARRLGMESPLQEVNSNVLGTSNTTMLDMATAYSTFANRGVHIEPSYVTRVSRSDGTVLWEWRREQERILDARLTDQLSWILEGVITQGTGHRADFGRPAAGKTGTTQNYADAVFVGYTPQRTTAVWVGFPEAQIPMVPPTTDRKVYGGTYPALIWKDVMEAAHVGLPVASFAAPPPSSTTTTTRPPVDAVPTPELVGMTLDNAALMLEAAETDIRIVNVVRVEVQGSEPGTIIGQSPGIGTSIRPNGSMLVEVVVEPAIIETVSVPDLVGRLVEDAAALLTAEGLGYETTEVDDPDDPNAPVGVVWWQDPVPGTEVAPGTLVAVRVSQ